MRISTVGPEITYPLRRDVMGWNDVVSQHDLLPDVTHSAVTSSEPTDTVLAVGSSGSLDCPLFTEASGYKFWGVAVRGDLQRLGLGRLMMEHIVDTAVGLEKEILWADARQTALGFYSRLGFQMSSVDRSSSPNSGLRNYMIYREL